MHLFVSLALCVLLASPTAVPQAIKLGHLQPHPNDFSFSSLTVSASPAAVNFNLVNGGAAAASSTIALTTAYSMGSTLSGTLTLYGFFGSPSNALTGGAPSASIPSSDVYGLVPTGSPTAYTAFTQITPYSGASGLQLYSTSSVGSATGSRTDNLSLKIDLAVTPQLPAATYTGTLTFEAQSF